MGNAEKYRSFREAWSRIDISRKEGFYFEAITLEESIISDRLASYLNAVKVDTNKLWDKERFFTLIRIAGQTMLGPVNEGEFSDLFKSLDKWRLCRNKAIHSFAKSASGTPTAKIEDALKQASCAADIGAELARAILNWHKKQSEVSQKAGKVVGG